MNTVRLRVVPEGYVDNNFTILTALNSTWTTLKQHRIPAKASIDDSRDFLFTEYLDAFVAPFPPVMRDARGLVDPDRWDKQARLPILLDVPICASGRLPPKQASLSLSAPSLPLSRAHEDVQGLIDVGMRSFPVPVRRQ